MKAIELSPEIQYRRGWIEYFYDFDIITPFTATAPDSGALTGVDEIGGVGLLSPSDGTVADNDEIYVLTPKENFLFVDDQPLIVEIRLSFQEAATNAANVVFGVMDAVGANAMVDNGAGPKTSYSGGVFYKVDGGTLWNTQYSLAAAQDSTLLNAANAYTNKAYTAGITGYQVLRIEFLPTTSSKLDVNYYIDTGDYGLELVKRLKDKTYTSATEMNFFAGVKNGGGTQDTIKVDYMFAAQRRAAL